MTIYSRYKEISRVMSNKNNIQCVISGGLFDIQLTIEPRFTRDDELCGSLVLLNNDIKNNNNIVKIYDKIEYIIFKYSKSKNILTLYPNNHIGIMNNCNNSVLIISRNNNIIGNGTIIDGIGIRFIYSSLNIRIIENKFIGKKY